MIDHLIGFSIRNKIIIGLFALALVFWGVYSLTRLPIDAVPDITNNQVQVITTAPTLAAQETERFITFPIELAMANIPNIMEIRSISRFGLSVVTVVFEDNVDILDARQLIAERLKVAETQIPPGIGVPEMAPISTGLGEIYQYVLHTKEGTRKKYSPMELRTIQDWIVRRQILGTQGVADVSSFGGYLKQYEIGVDPEKLRSMNVTMSEIFDALKFNNQNTGGAYIDKGPNSYFIRGLGLVTNLDDIKKIVVKDVRGIPVLIRDIAEVKYGSAVRYGAMTRNNEGEVVGGIVLMLKGANSSEVIQNVKEKIQVIQKTLPEGVVIEPFLDRTHLIDRAIHTVSKNLIEGGLIVIFVLVLFLGNLRAGFVVASVIPLAMLFAISMMNLFGVSGNLMSLGAIDFGLIVDGAVIIVEAIVHNIAGNKKLQEHGYLSRKQMDEQVYLASVQIRKSAAFGEIIILTVYLPILALVGVEGKMFRPMAETVSFAILGALILSLTYVPMMSALFLSRKTTHKKNISDRMMERIHKGYLPVIHYAIRNKAIVVMVSVVLLAVSLFIFSRLGGEFVPTLEEGDFAVETRIMPGSSLDQTVRTALKAAEVINRRFPSEVKMVVGKVGTSEIPTDPMPLESCDLMIILKDKDQWKQASSTEELANKMSDALSVIPGITTSFQQPIQMRFNELMTGARQDVAIKIFGEDLDVLAAKASEVANVVRKVEGAADLYVEQVTGLPQIMVEYKRDKLAQYGLSVETVNRIVRTAFAGESAGLVYEGERRFELVVRLRENLRKDITDVRSLYVPLATGVQIPITEVADIELKEGPMQISRENTRRRITIGVNVRNRDVESLVHEVQQKLNARVKLHPGYTITYGGQFENLQEAKKRLSVAVPVALGLILILLYFTFGSFKETLLIFTAIPFSAIGGVLALWLRGMPFSISAGVGFIALFGVAVLNGIVLISYFNHLRDQGMTDIKERVLVGTELRLRPVLMTASVASLGFLPMALSGSAGAEVQRPLATVVIGGLVSATLLTLVVLPVLYMYFMKDKKKDGRGGVPPVPAAVIVLIVAVAGLMLPVHSSAQDVPAAVTAEQAIDIALQNNGSIQTGNYEIQARQALKRTSFELPRTNVGIMYGQFNSILPDNNITISQDFSLPSVYLNQAKLNQASLESAEQQLAVRKNELVKNVKSSYYQLMYLKEKRKFLLYQDSLYVSFAEATGVKLRTGEANYLENLTAQTQLMEIRNQLALINADIISTEKQLQALLNTNDKIVPVEQPLPKLEVALPADSSEVSSNPNLGLLRKQIGVNHAFLKVERSQLLPVISLGYFNQSLTGPGTNRAGTGDVYYPKSKRFQGVQAGVSLPLWYRPYQARITAAKLNERAAESNYRYAERNLEGELAVQWQQVFKYRNSLEYYEKNALPNADVIISNGNIAYREGEVSYLEYLQSLSKALSIKSAYLDNLNFYNQSIITVQYLLGEK